MFRQSTLDKIIVSLKQQIQEFQQHYVVPIKGVLFENMLYNSFCEVLNEKNIQWNATSHNVGYDIVVKGKRISCKSGKIINKKKKGKFLCISSYRTTSYERLEQKIFFLNQKHEDYFFCLVHDKNNYKLVVFDRNVLDFSSLTWYVSSNGWHGSGDFYADIVKKMSDQLWINIPIDWIKVYEI